MSTDRSIDALSRISCGVLLREEIAIDDVRAGNLGSGSHQKQDEHGLRIPWVESLKFLILGRALGWNGRNVQHHEG